MGMYRGFLSTILRDIPYAGLQFPLWELFKVELAIYKRTTNLTPAEGAVCGAFAGIQISIKLLLMKLRIFKFC